MSLFRRKEKSSNQDQLKTEEPEQAEEISVISKSIEFGEIIEKINLLSSLSEANAFWAAFQKTVPEDDTTNLLKDVKERISARRTEIVTDLLMTVVDIIDKAKTLKSEDSALSYDKDSVEALSNIIEAVKESTILPSLEDLRDLLDIAGATEEEKENVILTIEGRRSLKEFNLMPPK